MNDLNQMSLEELKKLRRDVEKAIETYKDREKIAALAEVESLAREKGFSLAELLKSGGKKSRSGLPPKFVNPADPSQTWTGRGRRPKWIEAALAEGKSLGDLAIAQ
ncbi:H-NS histone family protein [Rhodobacteraceae bacterium 2376]|uniref:H-NS histone family protein n=2 Tax=Rhabdonatronobacter sediminivivens TaxID=2743469 RepID=A0A7Z0I0F7_9RHOB|nr:H-NS histone family protein [Rhabdonatronobacter sediminivivens]NYS25244.1 H-NS histone family protein [Rhabdonatronobacter sediminivivens]